MTASEEFRRRSNLVRGGIALLALVASSLLSACQVMTHPESGIYDPGLDAYTHGTRNPTEMKFYASDEAVQEGKRQFENGNFGLAQAAFLQAVKNTPRDASAWVGLAASYDRLRRFDLADQAYDKATALTGKNAALLNNRGYSHLLRGDLTGARGYFLAAYELEPQNPVIVNNLVLLSQSGQSVQRREAAYQ